MFFSTPFIQTSSKRTNLQVPTNTYSTLDIQETEESYDQLIKYQCLQKTHHDINCLVISSSIRRHSHILLREFSCDKRDKVTWLTQAFGTSCSNLILTFLCIAIIKLIFLPVNDTFYSQLGITYCRLKQWSHSATCCGGEATRNNEIAFCRYVRINFLSL
jgi:hypothetical protein